VAVGGIAWRGAEQKRGDEKNGIAHGFSFFPFFFFRFVHNCGMGDAIFYLMLGADYRIWVWLKRGDQTGTALVYFPPEAGEAADPDKQLAALDTATELLVICWVFKNRAMLSSNQR
jgi:hypothetical protein